MGKRINLTIVFIGVLVGFCQAQWTDNGSSITTSDQVGINTTNPGSYQLNVNGAMFLNGMLTFPTASHSGTTTQTLLQFPSSTDSGSLISRQLASDRYELIFKIRDNTTGDAFKLWFDDYRGSNYDRYPFIVYGNKVLLAEDGGNVGIGTSSPSVKLAVNGTTKTKEVIVTDQPSEWPDYVFEEIKDWESTGGLRQNLEELKTYIESNRHLPGIPTKVDIEQKGQNLGSIQAKLLEKIEQLTLYVIHQQQQIDQLKIELNRKK